MVKPEDKPMKKQWLEVDGRMTLVILPQIWSHDLEDWVVTSDQNPLPTRVTGSNVEDGIPIKQVVSVFDKLLIEEEEIVAGGYYTIDAELMLPFFVLGVYSLNRDLNKFEVIISWRDSENYSFTSYEKIIDVTDDFRKLTEKKTTRTKKARIRVYNHSENNEKFSAVLTQMAN